MFAVGVTAYLNEEVRIPALGPCLIWQRCLTKGYGRVQVAELDNQSKPIHQVMWFLKYGYWPRQLNHKCNQKSCGQLSHLYEGNQKQNMEDRKLAGYTPPIQKLTADQVTKIRELYATTDCTQKDLGILFGVGTAHISDIIRGASWRLT